MKQKAPATRNVSWQALFCMQSRLQRIECILVEIAPERGSADTELPDVDCSGRDMQVMFEGYG